MATKAANLADFDDVDGEDAIAPDGPWRSLADLDNSAAVAVWDDLAHNAAEPNIFHESWFLLPSLREFGADTRIFAPTIDSELIGILPVVDNSHYGRWPVPNIQNWRHPNIFLGTPLVRKGRELDFWQTLLAELDSKPGRALFLHIHGLTTNGPIAEALAEVCGRNRRFAEVEHSDRALLQSALSPEEYYAANMRGKKRKELRRQKNRLSDEGALTFMGSDGSSGLAEWSEEFLALENAGWKGQNGSALSCAPATRRLFLDVLGGAAMRGKLQLLDLRLDGRPLAMLVNFLGAPGSFSFKTAFDENYSRFSPGVLLQIENLALLNNPDIAWSDSCAAEGHPMIDSIWAERRRVGRFSLAIGGTGRRMLFSRYLAMELSRAKKRAALAQNNDD